MDKNEFAANYAFGIEEIDEQHLLLFGFLDDLEAALNSEQRWVVVHEVLVRLGHWAEVHFAVEEALMGIMGYPGTQQHREMHNTFVRRLEEKTSKLLRDDIAVETATWLRDWLIHHIAVEDRAYAEYFRRCFVRPS